MRCFNIYVSPKYFSKEKRVLKYTYFGQYISKPAMSTFKSQKGAYTNAN